jgi:hypothetical protein
MAWTGRAEPAAAAALRVLVAWYGSFAGHGTIGDLLSLESVVARLVAEGWGVAHLSAADVVIPGATRVEDADFDPAAFGAVVFVCGPIIAGHPQTESLFARCRGRPLVGVGVSLFTPDHASHADPFTTVLARQGGRRPFEDVALVAPSPALPPRKALPGREQVIGLALRGPQGEYGADACLWERTERLARVAAERLLERSGGRLELIENHLARSGRRPEEIESQYARCDLVITSRFHGAMLALRHGVPFVAIDQIRGGGKVEPLLAGRGWPHVFRAEDAERRRRRSLSNRDRSFARCAAEPWWPPTGRSPPWLRHSPPTPRRPLFRRARKSRGGFGTRRAFPFLRRRWPVGCPRRLGPVFRDRREKTAHTP